MTHFFYFNPQPNPMPTNENEFLKSQARDAKYSKGFYFFIICWIVGSVVWLLCGGAEDGAWLMLAVGGTLLALNAVAAYVTRPRQ